MRTGLVTPNAWITDPTWGKMKEFSLYNCNFYLLISIFCIIHEAQNDRAMPVFGACANKNCLGSRETIKYFYIKKSWAARLWSTFEHPEWNFYRIHPTESWSWGGISEFFIRHSLFFREFIWGEGNEPSSKGVSLTFSILFDDVIIYCAVVLDLIKRRKNHPK